MSQISSRDQRGFTPLLRSYLFTKLWFLGRGVTGFTLIELLIVLSIISVVAVVVSFSVINTLKQARDARRRSDILEIRIGLERYYGEQDAFPASLEFTNQPLVGPAGQVYLPNVHPDPVNRDPYLFTYWASPSASWQSYTLCAYRLESQSGSFCVQSVE